MNGPDHYAEAERLPAIAAQEVSESMVFQTGEHKADVIAAAQAHATLALVAATADARTRHQGSEGSSTYVGYHDDWVKVLEPAVLVPAQEDNK